MNFQKIQNLVKLSRTSCWTSAHLQKYYCEALQVCCLLIALPSPRKYNILHDMSLKCDKIKPRSNHDSNQNVKSSPGMWKNLPDSRMSPNSNSFVPKIQHFAWNVFEK